LGRSEARIEESLSRWDRKHRLIPHLVVFCILSFLTAKVIFRSHSSNSILYFYGICVTASLSVTFTIAFTRYKDYYLTARKKVESLEDKEEPLVSFLVAAFNEEDIVRRCIHSLVKQTYLNREIIVVDDCSTDGTARILDELAQQYDIKVIHLTKNVGKKGALAAATLAAKGTIYAFTDSDSTWEEHAIERIVKIFRCNENVGAVSGHTRALNADKNLLTKVQDSWYEGQYSVRKAFESSFGTVSCVSGPLAVFRKEAIYNFMPAWKDDTFLGQEFRFATDRTLTAIVLGNKYIGKKLLAKHPDKRFQEHIYPPREWDVIYCKAAHAWTQVPDTFRRVIKQQVRWKKSFLRNIFYTGSFYWHKPFLPALMYYLRIVFVLVGPFVAFRHMIYLPLHGNFGSMLLYLGGISFIGFMFGLAYKLEEPQSHRWIYRPLMSLFSTLILSWLIFYSAATIRKSIWDRS
jgi:cellulose synthase/poly-beta-1,6-N-acetylglucosamine synthase-like glycosyltransferase